MSQRGSYTYPLPFVTVFIMRGKPWMRVVQSVLLAIAVTGGLSSLASAVLKWNRWQHSGLHIAFGAGFTVLLIASQLAWPAPRQGTERWLRRGLVLGFAIVVMGSALEAVGAFGYALDNGNNRTNGVLAGFHTIGLFVGPLGMVAILVGLIGTAVERGRVRIQKKDSTT